MAADTSGWGSTVMRSPNAKWSPKPDKVLDPSLLEQLDEAESNPRTPPGFMAYLGEAVRREATAG